MNRSPRVIALAYTDLPSDARVIRESREVVRRGAHLTLLTPEPTQRSTPPGLEEAELVWLPVSQERGQTTLRGHIRFMRTLAAWRRTYPGVPDIVHIHNMPDYLYWAVRPWQKAGARVVVDVHDMMSRLALHRFHGLKARLASAVLSAAEGAVWARVDHVVTVHEEYRCAIIERGIPEDRVSAVLNVADPEVIHAGLRRRPDPDSFKIVFHGSITRRSGAAAMVHAMALLRRQAPEARMLIIGAGAGSDAVWAAIREHNLEEVVEYVDRYLPLPVVIERVADADVAVVAPEQSRFTADMLPVKLLEYCALGIPSVATRLPLTDRYIGSEAAILLDDPAPERIAAALLVLRGDPQERARLAHGARDVAERHRWDRYGDELARALGLPGQLGNVS